MNVAGERPHNAANEISHELEISFSLAFASFRDQGNQQTCGGDGTFHGRKLDKWKIERKEKRVSEILRECISQFQVVNYYFFFFSLFSSGPHS